MGYASRLHYKGSQSYMIVYKLDFTSDKANYFSMLTTVFRTRGSAQDSSRVDRTDRKVEAQTIRAMKKIGSPVGEGPKDLATEFDIRLLKLNPEGGILELTQDSYKKLEKQLETMQWPSAIADVVLDFEEWFLAFKAEEVKD